MELGQPTIAEGKHKQTDGGGENESDAPADRIAKGEKMKKSIKYGAVFALCITLAACGKSGNRPSVPEPQNSPGTVSVSPAESKTVDTKAESGGTVSTEEKAGEDDFYGEVIDGGFVLKRCNSEANEIVVPETIQGAPVVKIGEDAFSQLQCESVILPSSVTEIDTYAFFECTKLKNVELGEGVQVVGKYVFISCKSLESVRFPESLVKIESVIFNKCDALSEVYIPASVTEIPEGIAFIESCPNLVIVTPAGSVAEQVAKEAGIPVRNE